MGVAKKRGRGGKKHSLIRSGKNKASGKYERQRKRTEENKKKKAKRHAEKYAPKKKAE
ncbi:MAG: hypothetical protein ACYTEQ_01825 [Planctomycetota bacterium]|jgi:hypothetical protein